MYLTVNTVRSLSVLELLSVVEDLLVGRSSVHHHVPKNHPKTTASLEKPNHTWPDRWKDLAGWFAFVFVPTNPSLRKVLTRLQKL